MNGSEIREMLIDSGVLRPGDPSKATDPEVRERPFLALDDIGRKSAAKDIQESLQTKKEPKK